MRRRPRWSSTLRDHDDIQSANLPAERGLA
jgi:hypothetical protein